VEIATSQSIICALLTPPPYVVGNTGRVRRAERPGRTAGSRLLMGPKTADVVNGAGVMITLL
jgi:hypothetical protein